MARGSDTTTVVPSTIDVPTNGAPRYENRMVLVLTAAGGVAALDAQAVFYLMPFISAQFSLSSANIGLIGSAVLVGWALGGMAIARLSDHMGQRKPFLIGAFVGFALLSGLSAVASGFLSLLLARFLIGIVEGPVIPIKQAMVIAESNPSRRGLNMGIVQNFGAQLIGTLIGPILLVAVAERFGWRWAFLIAGTPGLIIAILIWRLLREPPSILVVRRKYAGTDGADRGSLWTLLQNRNLILCMLIALVSVAWFFIMLTFLPLYLVHDLHYSPTGMSVIMSLIGAAGVTSAVIVPYLSDRIGRRKAISLFSAIGVLAPLGTLAAGSNSWSIGVMLVIGCQMLGTFPLVIATVPQESAAPCDRATATSMVIAVAQIGGGAAGPILAGSIADMAGYGATLLLSATLAVAAMVLAPFIRETLPIRP